MPKEIREEVGKVIRIRTVKTIGDKIKEALGTIAGSIFMIWIIVIVFGG